MRSTINHMENSDSSKYRLTIRDQTYGIKELGYTKQMDHKYLKIGTERITGVIGFIGEALSSHYVPNIPFNKFKIDTRRVTITYSDLNGSKKTSLPFNYRDLTDTLRKNGRFNPHELNLSHYECFWMDFSTNVRQQFYLSDETSSGIVRDGTPQQQYGKSFPIKPAIDREGFIITTFSPQLTRKIQQTRIDLVETSDKIFEFEWLYKLKDLVNDVISLLDITLLQIYTKAQFDPLQSWKTFDRSKIGEKHNRRLMDKIKWVKLISGKSANLERELISIKILKEVRNHLNHFDPPTFAVTFEEAADWMNQVLDVVFALCKIRRAIGVELSSDLINLAIQKKVFFNPESDFSVRKPQNNMLSGYQTSIWPND